MKIPDYTQNFLNALKLEPNRNVLNTPIQDLREDTAKAVAMCGVAYQDIFYVEDFDVKSSKHDAPIKTRFYLPTSDAKKLIIYVHGGGWCRGSIETYETHLRDMANRTGMAILSIEYGLAPENPFPTGVYDVVDVYLWVKNTFQNYKKFTSVYLMGDSGGGNIAAATICSLIDNQHPLPDAYVGIYPSLDFSLSQESYTTFGDGYCLTKNCVGMYIDHYVMDPKHKSNYLASPILYPNLDKFPPTYILTAELDPLADEQTEFCAELEQGGVEVTQKIVPGVIHPFMLFGKIFPEVPICIDWIKESLLRR